MDWDTAEAVVGILQTRSPDLGTQACRYETNKVNHKNGKKLGFQSKEVAS